MEQPVDSLFQFDECAVVREISDATGDDTVRGILLHDRFPRIRLRLLDPERELLTFLVDSQNHHLDLVARLDQLTRMVDPFRPRHFADVHETFDARLELDERPVTHHVHDFADDPRTDRVLLFDVFPRVLLELLQAQSDLFLLAVDLQDDDIDLLVDAEHLRGMADPFPTHVGDVQQPVDAAQIDEGSKVGDVLHDAAADLAFFELLHELLAVLFPLLFDQGATADDDVTPRFVDLEHFALDDAADEIADVAGTTNVDLAGGQEDIDADVDQQAAFDFARHRTRDDLALLDGGHHLFPLQDLLGLALAQHNHAEGLFGTSSVNVFHLFDDDANRIADLRKLLSFPLAQRDRSFALEAHIDQDEVVFDPDDLALHDLIHLETGLRFDLFYDRLGLPPHRGREFLLQFLIFVERTNEIPVDHVPPRPPGQTRFRRAYPKKS